MENKVDVSPLIHLPNFKKRFDYWNEKLVDVSQKIRCEVIDIASNNRQLYNLIEYNDKPNLAYSNKYIGRLIKSTIIIGFNYRKGSVIFL